MSTKEERPIVTISQAKTSIPLFCYYLNQSCRSVCLNLCYVLIVLIVTVIIVATNAVSWIEGSTMPSLRVEYVKQQEFGIPTLLACVWNNPNHLLNISACNWRYFPSAFNMVEEACEMINVNPDRVCMQANKAIAKISSGKDMQNTELYIRYDFIQRLSSYDPYPYLGMYNTTTAHPTTATIAYLVPDTNNILSLKKKYYLALNQASYQEQYEYVSIVYNHTCRFATTSIPFSEPKYSNHSNGAIAVQRQVRISFKVSDYTLQYSIEFLRVNFAYVISYIGGILAIVSKIKFVFEKILFTMLDCVCKYNAPKIAQVAPPK